MPSHRLAGLFVCLLATHVAAQKAPAAGELSTELRQELCRAGDGMVATGNVRGAVALYDSAARGGSGAAAFRIAMLHDRTGNRVEAGLWWKRAADLGVSTPMTSCLPGPCPTAPIPPC